MKLEGGVAVVTWAGCGIEGEIAPTADCAENIFDHVVAPNLRGVLPGTKYGLRQILKQGVGRLLLRHRRRPPCGQRPCSPAGRLAPAGAAP